jgi:hypothetical protein
VTTIGFLLLLLAQLLLELPQLLLFLPQGDVLLQLPLPDLVAV